MSEDLKYRLDSRLTTTEFGRPLYYNPNIQIVMTQECPYNCPFCLERKNPMSGENNFEKQIQSLIRILKVHPTGRLTITGGEPSLYLDHVKTLIKTYKLQSSNKFCTINTTGYNQDIGKLGKINLSVNQFVQPDLNLFPDAIYQTVLNRSEMTINNIKSIMDSNVLLEYSFRFMTDIEKQNYDVSILNDIQEDAECSVKVFRVGDFFLYTVFEYNGKKARITLGDMCQQQLNNYGDGYSNIIIHPNGSIRTNWK